MGKLYVVLHVAEGEKRSYKYIENNGVKRCLLNFNLVFLDFPALLERSNVGQPSCFLTSPLSLNGKYPLQGGLVGLAD